MRTLGVLGGRLDMQGIESWWHGLELSREGVLAALAPVMVVSAYFFIGWVTFCIRCLRHGVPHDYETEARGRTALVGYHMRYAFFHVVNPIWRLLLASGISANVVTVTAALLGVGAAGAAAFGRFGLAGWLFIFSGIMDAMDGRLARARNQVSPAGAAIDSILDRYTDALMLIGLGVYYRDTWVLLPVLLALLGTSLVPYVRAKSEALGFPVRDGLMQRTERIVYLGTTVALSPVFEALFFPRGPRPMYWMAVAGIVFLAIASNVTAVWRFLTLVHALTAAATRPMLGRDKHRAA
jgi:phosphatidylglycerophosphate synthase